MDAMNTENLDKWRGEALDLPGPVPRLRVPVAVLLQEAADCVRFAQRYWEPELDACGKVVRPGLASAVGTGQFAADIAEQTLELLQALQTAQTELDLIGEERDPAPVARARFVMSEIKQVLAWYFDDGVEDERDVQLARWKRYGERAMTHDALAVALFQWAALAERHQVAIDGVGGFDAALIEEARALADALQQRSAGPADPAALPQAPRARDLRNRVGALLLERVRRMRAAARFVFRRHPAIVREVTSAYGRQQRRESQRRESQRRTRGAAANAVSAAAPV